MQSGGIGVAKRLEMSNLYNSDSRGKIWKAAAARWVSINKLCVDLLMVVDVWRYSRLEYGTVGDCL